MLAGKSDGVIVDYDGGVLRIQGRDTTAKQVKVSAGVMGGDACIRDTRIPVWLVVRCKQLGFSDERILSNYPELTAADLIVAWDFYAAHAEQVEAERRSHEAAA